MLAGATKLWLPVSRLASRRRLWLTALLVPLILAIIPRPAGAATVTVLRHNGRTHQINNRFLTDVPALPTPDDAPLLGPLFNDLPDPLSLSPGASARIARAAHALTRATRAARAARARARHNPQDFPAALKLLISRHQIKGAAYRNDLHIWKAALWEEKHIAKWRGTQLADVTSLLHELSVRGQVTAARLPVLIVMLNRNAQYWRHGKRLVYPDRVQFAGSELVWQYYPGYGLQFQVLGTFGEGDGYYESGAANYPKLATLMNEVQRMAVHRAGGITWEYYFNWEGGKPPWVSAMAQATGIEALTNAYLATGNHAYLAEAHEALPLLERHPPAGTAVAAAHGSRYLQYSFAPRTRIINAFLQTLLGLYDYEQASLDPTALALYNAGNAQAQIELPSFIIGGWSLYQPGVPDNLNYHELVTGFLKLLCEKTNIPVYCSTYQTFTVDLLSKPWLAQLTVAAVANRRFSLRFELSKYAAVGVTLTNAAGKRFLYRKANFYAGTRGFRTPKLKPGIYSLAMSATDPAGNYTSISGQVNVCATSCPPYNLAPPPPPPSPPPPTTTTTTPTTTTPTTTTPAPTTTSTTTTTSPTTTAPPPTTTQPGTGASGI